MKHNLVQEISAYLSLEEIDLVDVASRFGVDALPTLKKIITTDTLLAPRAMALEKVIRQYWDDPALKKEKEVKQRFGIGMKTISTLSPDGHIKGFGSDMIRRK